MKDEEKEGKKRIEEKREGAKRVSNNLKIIS